MPYDTLTIVVIEPEQESFNYIDALIKQQQHPHFTMRGINGFEELKDVAATHWIGAIFIDDSFFTRKKIPPYLEKLSDDIPLFGLISESFQRLKSPKISTIIKNHLKKGNFSYQELYAAIHSQVASDEQDIHSCINDRQRLKKALMDLRFALASEKVLLKELDEKNKELRELSITDGLTGLYNHRFIQERFEFEFKRAQRYNTMLSCMLIDIDEFKKINDTHGHQFGDYILKEISAIIKDNTRKVDICGRYGGDEFLIITTQNEIGASKHAVKLHQSISKKEFIQDSVKKHITVSIGIAQYHGDEHTKNIVIEHADKALYCAKREGKNTIRTYRESPALEAALFDIQSMNELKKRIVKLSRTIRLKYVKSADVLLKIVDEKDHYTLQHCRNVAFHARLLADACSNDTDEIETIYNAGLLHDIGKAGIANVILLKPQKLNSAEREVLQKHPTLGVNLLKDISMFEYEIPLIQHHHEWYDGSGYPHGLRGRDIPLGSRIITIADAFDAMLTERCYKHKLTELEAFKELEQGRGIQFCPELVDVFIELMKEKTNLGALSVLN